MTPSSIVRIVVPSAVLVAACGAALVFGLTRVSREPPAKPPGAPAAMAVPQAAPASPEAASPKPKEDKPKEDLSKQAAAEGLEVLGALGPSKPTPADEGRPAFDVARIESTGEAVIAGRAAPGATVELLRNGEHHDQAVADASGLFVMVPPRLPPGEYELTLRSKSPDGTLATSQKGVAVSLNEVSGPPRSSSSAPSGVNDRKTAAGLPADGAGSAPGSREGDQPSPEIAKREGAAVSKPPQQTAAISPPDQGASPPAGGPRAATAVVSRGDSLWRISRMTYGDGSRYSDLFRANRGQIRNPNLIYPGQVFVLPRKSQ